MYIISAVICFLAVGTYNIDLCFNSQVPLKFKNIEECRTELNKLIDYTNADLQERNTRIVFSCIQEKIEEKKIDIKLLSASLAHELNYMTP